MGNILLEDHSRIIQNTLGGPFIEQLKLPITFCDLDETVYQLDYNPHNSGFACLIISGPALNCSNNSSRMALIKKQLETRFEAVRLKVTLSATSLALEFSLEKLTKGTT